MERQANVAAIEALETFRSHLVQFMIDARGRVDDTRDAVRRTRQWVEHDRRLHWEAQLRNRKKALESAELELFSARLSGLHNANTSKEELVRRCRRGVEEAEEKLRKIKKWSRDFEETADPMLRRLQRLRDLLDEDVPKGIAWLAQAQRILDEYAETFPPTANREDKPPEPTPPEALGA